MVYRKDGKTGLKKCLVEVKITTNNSIIYVPSCYMRMYIAMLSGDTAADTYVSFARRQQGEQTQAEMGVVF